MATAKKPAKKGPIKKAAKRTAAKRTASKRSAMAPDLARKVAAAAEAAGRNDSPLLSMRRIDSGVTFASTAIRLRA